jgi:predicted nucleotidyltransferase
MKLIAWDERGTANSKDASDLFMIMHKYQFIHDGRVWDDYVPAEYTDDFESDVICAFLLGYDLSLIIREPSLIILRRIFEEKNESLITAILRATNQNNEDQLEKMIAAFWCGIFDNN